MKKILVVDDEEKITSVLKDYLRSEGYEVREANDSHRATNLLVTEKNFDLILLDIHMPLVDGASLYEIAKQYDPDIKVIVTSVDPVEDQEKLIVKADDYYQKSEGPGKLLLKIRQVIGEFSKNLVPILLTFLIISTASAETIQGTITSLDPAKDIVNITRTDTARSPEVVNVRVQPETKTVNAASLKELQVGQEVRVEAKEDPASGVWEARSVEVLSARVDSRSTITPSGS